MALSDIREPAVKHIQVTTGDSPSVELHFKSGGSFINMAQYDASVAPIIDPVNDQQLDEWAVDLTNAATGVIVLTLTTIQTSALCPCQATWYFQAIDSSNPTTNTFTSVVGDFTVLKRRAFGG